MYPKIRSAQNFLKCDTFDISNMSISNLMLKINFFKYLTPVRHKFVPKLKMLRIYWNLAHLVFQTCRSQF